jgi:methyl-accepting chemotaxis protein
MSELTAILVVFSTNQNYRRSLAELTLTKADVHRVKKKLQLQDWLSKNQAIALAIANTNDIQINLNALVRDGAKSNNIELTNTKSKNQLELVNTLNKSLEKYPQLDSIVFVSNNNVLLYLDGKSLNINNQSTTISDIPININISDRTNNNGEGYLTFQGDEPIISFANPIFDESGNKIGSLLINSKLERFSEIMATSPNLDTENGRFDNYLIGQISSNKFFVIKNSLEIKNDADFAENITIKQALAGVENASRYRSYTGINVLGSYGKFDGLDIIVISEINEKTALATGDRIVWNMLVIATGAVLLMTAICYLLIRYQMQAVVEITDIAAEIVKGDLDAKFPLGGKDEMGALAIALNHMLAKFKRIEQESRESGSNQSTSLDEATNILSKYINITSEGFMLLDSNDLIIDINANFAEILSISITEAIGVNSSEVLPQEISKLVNTLVNRSLNQLDSEEIFQVEFQLPYHPLYLFTISPIINTQSHNYSEYTHNRLVGIIIIAKATDSSISLNSQNNNLTLNQSLLNSAKYRQEVSQKLRIPMTSLLGFLKLTQQKLTESIMPKIGSPDDKTKRAMQQVSQNLEVMISEGTLIAKAIGEVLRDDDQIMAIRPISEALKLVAIAKILHQVHSEAVDLCHQKNTQLLFEANVDTATIQTAEHDVAKDLLYVFNNLLHRVLLTANYSNMIFHAQLRNHQVVITIGKVNLGLSHAQIADLANKLYAAVSNSLSISTKPKHQTTQGNGLMTIQNIIQKYGGNVATELIESNRESYQFYVLTLPIISN